MTTSTPEQYIEASVSVPRELCDAVCSFIVDNIAGGMILEEEEDSPLTGITFYVPESNGSSYKQKLTDYLGQVLSDRVAPPEIHEKLVRNIEWVEQYKATVRPLRIADDVVIRPPWELTPAETKFDIVIEPKMAFGTGSHETTRSCLTVIRNQFRAGSRFLDLGTGSGILSILAAKMGANYIKAVDYDSVAVENCRENFAINQISSPYEILFGSIEKCDGDRPYDFVCANIIKSTILPVLPRLTDLTVVDGILVLSGLLAQDERDVSISLERLGQNRFEILHDNEWITYTMVKK